MMLILPVCPRAFLAGMQDCAFVDVELLRATIESLGGSIESISNPNGSGMAYPPGLLPDHKEM
ncbi:MAG: hypothetical protein ACLR7Z_17260 [Bilophila wadsworthia]